MASPESSDQESFTLIIGHKAPGLAGEAETSSIRSVDWAEVSDREMVIKPEECIAVSRGHRLHDLMALSLGGCALMSSAPGPNDSRLIAHPLDVSRKDSKPLRDRDCARRSSYAPER